MAVISSLSSCYELTWLNRAMFLVILTIFCTTIVSCSRPGLSYGKNCALFVPESTPRDPESTTIPFPPNQYGFFLGGDRILNHQNSSQYHYFSSSESKTLLFLTHNVYATAVHGVYKVQASLILQPSGVYYADDYAYSYSYSVETFADGSMTGALSFEVEGFWSKPSGKLCMVGSSRTKSPEGESRDLAIVLKLYGIASPSNITSLVRGTLDSLSAADDSSYFESISLLMFPKRNYKYTEVSKAFDHGCKGKLDVPPNSSLSLPLSKPVCSVLSQYNSFDLVYSSGCNSTKTCSPFRQEGGFSPQFMSLSFIQCSDDKQSPRFLVEFSDDVYSSYYRAFHPNTTLISEGSWDAKKNQLCVVACRILDASKSLNSSHVEDCSIRLSLRFPSVWSIGNASAIVGDIWSVKNVNDPGYFDRITFRSHQSRAHGIPGLKYNYTLVDKARMSCPKEPGTNKRSHYLDRDLYDMQFDMSVKNSSGKRIGWGYSQPIFVADKPWNRNGFVYSSSRNTKPAVQDNSAIASQLNVSIGMSLPSLKASSDQSMSEILAEGIYDPETGKMCLVGCRHFDEKSQVSRDFSMDCEILVKLQFPPVYSNRYIKGSIESKRAKSDPLYFGSHSFTAVPFSHYGRESWRMDLEIIMNLISNTLACLFVVYQILYTRRHPDACLSISLVMLVVLTSGQMIPLVLNFEALFFSKGNHQSFSRDIRGWLELNEVLVRALTMLAFLLQFRLLQIVWSARRTNGNQKASWVAEKKTLYVSLPVLIAGGLIALLVNWKNYKFNQDQMQYLSVNNHQNSLWADLRSYAGLILDCFLVPQILLNIFYNSRDAALSRFFYIGTTLVRLLPHAYDLYRAHYYNDDFDWSYTYANRSTDYYSTCWDVIIPLLGLVFAAILYLQQRFSGRFFLPKRFKELEGYEKVPVVSEA